MIFPRIGFYFSKNSGLPIRVVRWGCLDAGTSGHQGQAKKSPSAEGRPPPFLRSITDSPSQGNSTVSKYRLSTGTGKQEVQVNRKLSWGLGNEREASLGEEWHPHAKENTASEIPPFRSACAIAHHKIYKTTSVPKSGSRAASK